MQIYMALEGDRVRALIDNVIEHNDEAGINFVLSKIDEGYKIFDAFALESGGEVFPANEGVRLYVIDARLANQLRKLSDRFEDTVGSPVSIGLGLSVEQATLAQIYAKQNGGGRVCPFAPDMRINTNEEVAKSETDDLLLQYEFEELVKTEPGDKNPEDMTPQDVDDIFENGTPYQKISALQSPHVSSLHISKVFGGEPHATLQYQASVHPKFGAEHLDAALKSPHRTTRLRAIRHPLLTPQHTETLLSDFHQNPQNLTLSRTAPDLVRHALLTPKAVYLAASNKNAELMQSALLENPYLGAEHAEAFVPFVKGGFGRMILNNSKISEHFDKNHLHKIADSLSDNINESIVNRLVQHPNTDKDVLHSIIDNLSSGVQSESTDVYNEAGAALRHVIQSPKADSTHIDKIYNVLSPYHEDYSFSLLANSGKLSPKHTDELVDKVIKYDFPKTLRNLISSKLTSEQEDKLLATTRLHEQIAGAVDNPFADTVNPSLIAKMLNHSNPELVSVALRSKHTPTEHIEKILNETEDQRTFLEALVSHQQTFRKTPPISVELALKGMRLGTGPKVVLAGERLAEPSLYHDLLDDSGGANLHNIMIHNPHVPQDVIERIALNHPISIRDFDKIMDRHQNSPEFLSKLLNKDYGYEANGAKFKIVRHPNLSYEDMKSLMNNEELRGHLAFNPSLPSDIIHSMVSKDFDEFKAAQKPHAYNDRYNTYDNLEKDFHRLLQHKNTPPELVAKIYEQTLPHPPRTVDAFAKNPHLSGELLHHLLTANQFDDVPHGLFTHPNLTARSIDEIRDKTTSYGEPYFPEYSRTQILGHPNTSPETLSKALQDPTHDQPVVVQVAGHPNTPTHILRDLANGSHGVIVNELASRNLVKRDPSYVDEYYATTKAGNEPSRVAVTLGSEKLRLLRDLVEKAGGTMHKKQLPPMGAIVHKYLDSKGNITSKKIQEVIDNMPKSEFNISKGTWSGGQQHTPEPSEVFQLNANKEQVEQLSKEGLWDLYNQFITDNLNSHRTVMGKIAPMGWVRYTKGADGIHIDEIQSDFDSDWESKIRRRSEEAWQKFNKQYPKEKLARIAEILFNGMHSTKLLHQAFHEYLRNTGHAGTKLSMFDAVPKSRLSMMNRQEPIPGHMLSTYRKQPPDLNYRLSPTGYGALKTQTNPDFKGAPTFETELLRFEKVMEGAVMEKAEPKTPAERRSLRERFDKLAAAPRAQEQQGVEPTEQAGPQLEEHYAEQNAAEPQSDAQDPKIKERVVRALMAVKAHAPTIEAIKQQDPELYTVIADIIKSMLVMAKQATGQDLGEPEQMQKEEAQDFGVTPNPTVGTAAAPTTNPNKPASLATGLKHTHLPAGTTLQGQAADAAGHKMTTGRIKLPDGSWVGARSGVAMDQETGLPTSAKKGAPSGRT